MRPPSWAPQSQLINIFTCIVGISDQTKLLSGTYLKSNQKPSKECVLDSINIHPTSYFHFLGLNEFYSNAPQP